jgi:hypothetical protein
MSRKFLAFSINIFFFESLGSYVYILIWEFLLKVEENEIKLIQTVIGNGIFRHTLRFCGAVGISIVNLFLSDILKSENITYSLQCLSVNLKFMLFRKFFEK